MRKNLIKALALTMLMTVLCIGMVITAGAECEHDWKRSTAWDDDSPYDCTKGGNYPFTCTRCEEYRVMYIEPKEQHELYLWDTYTTKCVEYAEYHCKNCSRGNTNEIISENHDWEYSYYGSCETGLEVCRYCPKCSSDFPSYLEPREHQGKKLTGYDDMLPDCEEGGNQWYKCEVCSTEYYEYIEPREHSWYETGTYTTECEKIAEYKCNNCRQTKEQVVDSWHDFYETERYGNCEKGATVVYNCYNCEKETYGTAESQPHTLAWRYNNDATCTKDGTKYSYCTVCDCEYIETVTAEGTALGHDYGDEWTVLLPATCYDRGIQVKHCSRCTSLTAEELPRTAHTDSDGDNKCDDCSNALSGTVVPDDSNTPDGDNTTDQPATPDNGEATDEETSLFTTFYELINKLLEFFKGLFSIIK